MHSFRTELENPVVERDILELERKIRLYREGKIDDERFRSLRLARGVYGQRQAGVQMIRIKLPFGRVSGEQLRRIAAVSDEYSTGTLHITTRQDIQIHYVSLERTPELWAELERDDVTLREACGNTVRNVTASETAGIDPAEPFDVTPYADALFRYFLRNPVCQEMGRKFKIAFSASEADTALTYMHDLGFIPVVRDGKRGFRVLIGGGLGSQPRHADLAGDFMPVEKIIPFTEGVLRVFDRHGERLRRMKARLKFLFNEIGQEAFLELVEAEQSALANQDFPIDASALEPLQPLPAVEAPAVEIDDPFAYELWRQTNIFRQKQAGFFAVGVRVPLGNFSSQQARELAALIKQYAGNELRMTLRQNLLIRHVREDLLPFFYRELRRIGLALPGYNSLGDITACPGTDTCNLGIAGSTGIALELERVLAEEYPQYLHNQDLTIKISGCMNACGQHMMAHIGFQGMTIKVGELLAPALQVLLGGGVLGGGQGRFADKLIKIPSKRGPQALRYILDDFEKNAPGENFLDYYDRQGDKYFYELLKPLSETDQLTTDDFIDWGHDSPYEKAIGVGECAGVIVDLVATLFLESEEKLEQAEAALEAEKWADSIYHAYASLVNSAKALLLTRDKQANSQAGIIALFDEVFEAEPDLLPEGGFAALVYQIQQNKPSESFATRYLLEAKSFLGRVREHRNRQLSPSESIAL